MHNHSNILVLAHLLSMLELCIVVLELFHLLPRVVI